MRYTADFEICDVCGKKFNGAPINIHGTYEYIKHTNFSNNIRVIFCRTKDVPYENRADAIVGEFFRNGNEKISKVEAIEYLECFKHYKHEDIELSNEVFTKIQNEIDKMK